LVERNKAIGSDSAAQNVHRLQQFAAIASLSAAQNVRQGKDRHRPPKLKSHELLID
jgi:hypothetical protein